MTAKESINTNTIQDIIMSIIHMFCNRINGERKWEYKIYCLLRHTLHYINERKKNYEQ